MCCEFCAKSYRYPRALLTHVIVAHPEERTGVQRRWARFRHYRSWGGRRGAKRRLPHTFDFKYRAIQLVDLVKAEPGVEAPDAVVADHLGISASLISK